MDTEGDYLYVIGSPERNSSGLIIIDLSDLRTPTIKGFIDGQTYNSTHQPRSGEMAASGSTVYLFAENAFGNNRRIAVIDVSEPNQPRFRISFGIQDAFPTALEATPRYLYVAGIDGLIVVDMADPSAPQILPSSPTRESGGCANTITEGGKLFFVGNDKLKIFSLENPEIPVELGSFDLPPFSCGVGGVRPLSKSGGKIFTTFANPNFPFGEVVLGIDVENSQMITASGSIAIQSENFSRGFSSYNNFAIVADGLAGLGIYNMGNSLDVNLTTRIPAVSRIADIIVKSDSYAYISTGSSGFHVVDISNPMSPHLVNSIFLPQGNAATDMLIKGAVLYVSTVNFDGVFVYDITDGSAPILKGDLGLKQRIEALTEQNDLLFLSQAPGGIDSPGRPGFRAVDIRNAPVTQLVGGVTTCCSGAPEATFNLPRGLKIDNSTIYLAAWSNLLSSINIFDVSNIERPSALGALNIDDRLTGFLLDQKIGYASTSDRLNVGQLNRIDFSNPANPTVSDSFFTQGIPKAFKDNRLYLAGGKLEVLDVSEPNSIELVDEISFQTPLPEPKELSSVTDLVIDGGFIFASVSASIGGVKGLMVVIELGED